MSVVLPFINVQQFEADPDVSVYFKIEAVIVLMPFFMWEPCGQWIDATGFFDLCMTPDFLRWQFTSRRAQREKFCYRFVSSYFPVSARTERRGQLS